jgi:hypothetical protein
LGEFFDRVGERAAIGVVEGDRQGEQPRLANQKPRAVRSNQKRSRIAALPRPASSAERIGPSVICTNGAEPSELRQGAG